MAKTLKCTARRMAGGQNHEHISHLWYVEWEEDANGKRAVSPEQVITRERMVNYIKQNGNTAVWCPDQNGRNSAWVHVNRNGYTEYVQTYGDPSRTNNLLYLPEK